MEPNWGTSTLPRRVVVSQQYRGTIRGLGRQKQRDETARRVRGRVSRHHPEDAQNRTRFCETVTPRWRETPH